MFENLFKLPLILDFQTSWILLVFTLILLIFVCFQLIFSKSLLKNVLLMSAFSMLISLCYLLMDAPDVAMTEVALGSCLSTCVLLNFIKMIGDKDKDSVKLDNVILAVILCVTIVTVLAWAGFELASYGRIDAQVQQHLSKYYLENTCNDTGIPAPVTAILASYRGFDTLGETTVILIAGIAVLLILSLKDTKYHRKNDDQESI